MARKVIITCAVTGAIHTPSMSPFLPVTGPEIAQAALGAAEAGAAEASAAEAGGNGPGLAVYVKFRANANNNKHAFCDDV